MSEEPVKRFVSIKQESLQKMSRCFANVDEAAEFITHMDNIVDELFYNIQIRRRTADDNDNAGIIVRQICTLLLFLRQNTELIHQLTTAMELYEVDEDEMKRIIEEGE